VNDWEVNLVSAFGRGETLALALQKNGFSVRILDFTAAYPSWCRHGQGPFPLMLEEYLPEQGKFLSEAERLPRGLSFWLPDGPIELNSPMTPYYAETRADVKALHGKGAEFREDWLRRFLQQWASPLHIESWSSEAAESFPFQADIGLIPSYDESQAMSFERFQAQGFPVVACQSIKEVQFVSSNLAEVMVEAGQNMAFSADQWIWCLSSRETEMLNSSIAPRIFNRGIWRAEWAWASFEANCEAGPWLDGFPNHIVVIGDVFLPWVYANATVLRRLQPDGFRVWMKVPAKGIGESDQRAKWAEDAEALLNARLSMAKWRVEASEWSVCPHAPVFEAHHRDWGAPSHKNFEWIAPEVLPRLDLGARLEREAECFERLTGWRNDQLKKQGAHRDPAVHAP
jgi:hypothetical protein